MKGNHDKIYIATKEKNFGNPDSCNFNQLLCNPPHDGRMYKIYVSQRIVLDMLEKLRVVCGHRAMRYVQKQIEEIKK